MNEAAIDMLAAKGSRDIVSYIVIAYAITWLILFPLSIYYENLSVETAEVWHAFGALGPATSSIIVIYVWKGKKGLAELKEGVLKHSGVANLIFALSPLILFIITMIIESVIGTFSFDQFLQDNNLMSMSAVLFFFLPSLSYGIFEEIGWRGFLLPSLQRKYNALLATIVLTVVWALWHTPLFFYRYTMFSLSNPASLIAFFSLMLSGSIVLTSLFNNSKGSILMVILWHITYDLVSSNRTGMATMIVSIAFVIIDLFVIVKYGIKSLSREKRIAI